MIEVLVLCEGKSDVHFIKGLIEGPEGRVKFLEGPDDLDKYLREGYYEKIVCGMGGKGPLSKKAKNLISTFRSLKGNVRIVYVKDRVPGNRIMENLHDEIEEFVGSREKFTQEKPNVVQENNEIIVSFRNIVLKYHVVGVDGSLELNIWEKIKGENRDAMEIDGEYDDVHDKIRAFCDKRSEDLDSLFERSVEFFDDERWFTDLKDRVNY